EPLARARAAISRGPGVLALHLRDQRRVRSRQEILRRAGARQAARQHGRRQVAGLPPGFDHAPPDVGGRAAQGRRPARDDPAQHRHRARRRHHRRSRSGTPGDGIRDYVTRFYSPIEDLWDSHLEGLIVTGTEPRSPNLKDEPYWASLISVLEWAEHHTHSAVWSCLATHAALLHLDGIARRPLDEKRFGIFECERVADHPL